MKNAVIYARYSSDRQNEMSITGQIAECRKEKGTDTLNPNLACINSKLTKKSEMLSKERISLISGRLKNTERGLNQTRYPCQYLSYSVMLIA